MTHSDRLPFKLNYWLLPLAWIYGFVVFVRNTLFDWGWIGSEEFDVPVFCVGNIAAGGTGKTPHVEYLTRLLSSKYQVAVLSRGYKRKTKGFILLNDTNLPHMVGDEPYQIKKEFPQAIVAVDSNRRKRIRKLIKLYPKLDVILLDDGFQHRYVRPQLSVMLVNYNQMPYEDYLLPVGYLREPYSAARERDNVLVVTKTPEELSPIDCRICMKHLDPYPYQSVFFSSYKYDMLVPLFPTKQRTSRPLSSLTEEESVLLVTGIANPKSLLSDFGKYRSKVNPLVFDDHHDFKQKDIKKIEAHFSRMQGDSKLIVTTEKDSVRLMTNQYLPEELKPYIYVLPIQVVLNAGAEFDKIFMDYVRKNKRHHRVPKA
ncbi:tetraacyldisaccharide 4'-kinase [Porphyromonadaceae bacterium]